MIEPGTILQERYRIQKQIGQGGMGAVYVAVDERFGSTVAIKQTLCMDDNYRKAIEREARLLNGLKHPALPRVSDHFLERDGQFLVMEFIPGEDLCCIVDETGKPFGADTVLQWADQLLDALHYLHAQENPVIHRDIKPQNLKLTPKGQIVLLDFGLAKGNPNESNNNTAAKSIFGYSRNYASLEQIQGTGTDPRSDLYSLSATIYHLLTGVPPEDALTRAMDVLSQRSDPLRPAHTLEPKVPKGVSAILSAAMDLNSDLRPESAFEMRSMLADHHRYEHLAVDGASQTAGKGHQIYSQPTKLMAAATMNQPRLGTEAKTELLTADDSHVTRLKDDPLATNVGRQDQTGSPRRFAVAAVGLSVLLLGSVIAGGVMIYGPFADDILIDESRMPMPVVEVQPAADVAEVPPTANINAALNAEIRRPVQADTAQRTSSSTTQPTAQTQAAEPEKLSPNARVIQTEEGQIIIDGDKIMMGEMKIVGNKMITPQGEFTLRQPPLPPNVFTGKEGEPPILKDLTPAQRRRIIQSVKRAEAERLRREAVKPPIPPQQQ